MVWREFAIQVMSHIHGASIFFFFLLSLKSLLIIYARNNEMIKHGSKVA